MSETTRHSVGTGVLTWDASERRSDRYGYVYLLAPGRNSVNEIDPTRLNIPRQLLGKRCTLLARVIETRESTHIGDLFHGVFPRTPAAGALIKLGFGVLSFIRHPDQIGLMPVEDRASNQWLNIRSLYDVHEQTVELIVEEFAAQSAAPEEEQPHV